LFCNTYATVERFTCLWDKELERIAAVRPSRAADPTVAAERETMADDEAKKEVIKESIRGIPDFPKPGILFWDVTTIMLNPQAFKYTIDLFVERYKDKKIDVIAGMRP
jgi:hypothetical protein